MLTLSISYYFIFSYYNTQRVARLSSQLFKILSSFLEAYFLHFFLYCPMMAFSWGWNMSHNIQ